MSKRDLHADLAICEAATAGPWKAREWSVPTADQYNVGSTSDDSELFTAWQGARYPGGPEVSAGQARLNALFAAEARTAWPHAIERAITAENALLALVEALERGDIVQARMSSGTDYAIYTARKAVGR